MSEQLTDEQVIEYLIEDVNRLMTKVKTLEMAYRQQWMALMTVAATLPDDWAQEVIGHLDFIKQYRDEARRLTEGDA